MKASRIRAKRMNPVILLLLVLVCAFCVFPLFWMVLMSLKTRALALDPGVWLFKPTFDNFVKVFENRNLTLYLRNSAVTVIATTLLSLILGSLAAYGFARFSFKRRESLAFLVLCIQMLPPMALITSLFVLAQTLRLFDTQLVLVITYMIFNIPFTIWMMRGFFEEIPAAIEEAAMIDGCSRAQIFYRILLPLTAPGLVATAIFCVINSWNEFVYAMFLTGADANTLPTTATLFLSVTGVVWGELASVGVITAFPVILFAVIVQRYMIRGLTFGAVTSS